MENLTCLISVMFCIVPTTLLWIYYVTLSVYLAVQNVQKRPPAFLQLFKMLLEMLCMSKFQEYLNRFTHFDTFVKSSTTPMMYVTNVTLSFNETFPWTFSALNVNVSQCSLDSVGLAAQSKIWSNDTEQLFVETATIMIRNSSFGRLNLNPRTIAHISECYMDGEFKDRSTLITANDSDISIQNCHFENFINKNGSTILFGHNNSHVTIENSVCIQHNSSKGVLLLQNNSSLQISDSTILKNSAFTLGYSAISLYNRIYAVVNTTLFRNNSALWGGAMIVENWCQVTLTNCTFTSNNAITGIALKISKSPNAEMMNNSFDKNRNFALMSPTVFNKTLLRSQQHEVLTGEKLNISKRSTRHHLHQNKIRTFAQMNPTLCNQTYLLSQKPEIIPAKIMINSTAHSLDRNNTGTFTPIICMLLNQMSPDVKEPETNTVYQTRRLINGSVLNNTVRQKGYLPSLGGAIQIVTQVQLLIKNCTFADNSADDSAGAISAGLNVRLDIEGTTFVGNKALVQGGGIIVQEQGELRTNNCTFTNNSAQYNAGAVQAGFSVTLDTKNTSFVGNKALNDRGAINVQFQVYLQITNCVFDENISERSGGAIVIGDNVTLDIQETNFTGNRATQSAAIDVAHQSYLHVTDCTFVDNHAKHIGGAISGNVDVVLEIENTSFTSNRAF